MRGVLRCLCGVAVSAPAVELGTTIAGPCVVRECHGHNTYRGVTARVLDLGYGPVIVSGLQRWECTHCTQYDVRLPRLDQLQALVADNQAARVHWDGLTWKVV